MSWICTSARFECMSLDRLSLRAAKGRWLVSHSGRPAMMSTSKDAQTAIDYSGKSDERGAIFQITFDISNRGADVKWISQYPGEDFRSQTCIHRVPLCSERLVITCDARDMHPGEEELLFPPGTSLTVQKEQWVGASKRVLQVKPGSSTQLELTWPDLT